MSPENHPEFETLLLWQTGELEAEQLRQVQAHLAHCQTCRGKLTEMDDLYSEADWAGTHVAEQHMHALLEQRQKPQFIQWVRNPWSATTAAGLIVALVLFTMSDLTPQARADTLLSRAATHEAASSFHPYGVRIRAGGQDCNVTLAHPDVSAVLASTSDRAACNAINQRLQSAGWSWSHALSAKNFQQWRSSLAHKHDEVRKLSDVTEVSTRTNEGPIREATLRMRNADYQTVAARVQLSTDNKPGSAIEMTEAPYTPVELASTPIPNVPPGVAHLPPPPTLTPLDRSEVEARLAMHRVGADTNILLAIDRQDRNIRVWGVAPTEDVKTSIAQALANIPDVSLAVMTEPEQRASQGPVPWQGSHGNGLPLAYDQINDLFKDESDHQAFLNDLDALTRRMIGEAKARDAVTALTTRDRSTEYAAPLLRAATDLERKLLADQRLLAQRLHPVFASSHPSVARRPAPLSYEEAIQVYLLIHQLFFADDGNGSMTADLALTKLEQFPL